MVAWLPGYFLYVNYISFPKLPKFVERIFILRTILLADDSRFMRTHLKRILHEANFKSFIEAENGVQAIDMYKRYSPDIVILDITMPLLNGIDALKEIIETDPNANIVMCTAMGGQSFFINKALKVGAKDFIVKPYFHNLISIVDKLC